MPPGDAIQRYLAGSWELMRGKPDGARLLDITADGFWNSFFAIVVALPALFVGWVAVANAIGGETFRGRLGTLIGLAVIDLATWIVPLALLAAVAGLLGIARRYVAYVVASNWGSVILVWAMLPPALMRLVWPAGEAVTASLSLGLFLATMVLSWRLTNAILGMGPGIASAVFAAMLGASLTVLLVLQSLLGLAPSP